MANLDLRVEGVRGVLVRLRTRAGLSAERLRSTEVDVRQLVDLPIVRHYMQVSGSEANEAVVQIVKQLTVKLNATDALIVDVALCLGLLRDRLPGRDVADALYAAELGDRRKRLVRGWRELHKLMNADRLPQQPTVRALRATLEDQAIGRLAELCVTSPTIEAAFAHAGANVQAPSEAGSSAEGAAKVVIVGAAVMDHIYAVDDVPRTGTSVQASSFVGHPGGKGLNQAVATARLGLSVELIAAVGDDESSDNIVGYLHREGVRTSLLQFVRSARAPTTVVAITPSGDSITIGWKNERQINLDLEHLSSRAMRVMLERASAVLLTFEPRIDAIQCLLDQLKALGAGRPLVVVNPSPPFENPQALYENFAEIDYLVGTPWELRGLLPNAEPGQEKDELATQLLLLGAGGVCIVEGMNCFVRAEGLSQDISRFPTALHDVPGARDAFSAALTYCLFKTGGKLTQDGVVWATAAMAATQSIGAVPSAMPSVEEIDRVLTVSQEQG